MENVQGGNSSATDARVASVGTDVYFCRGFGGGPRWGFFSGEHDAFVSVPRWEHRDYSEWCVGWIDQQRFAEVAFHGNNLVIYDWNRRAWNTAVGSYCRRWKFLGRTCAEIFIRFRHMDIPFVRHCDMVEYVRRLNNWLQKDTDTGMMDLACCCLRKPYDSYFLVRGADEYELKLDLEVRQRTKNHGFFVGWYRLEFFAVAPASRLLLYVLVCVF